MLTPRQFVEAAVAKDNLCLHGACKFGRQPARLVSSHGICNPRDKKGRSQPGTRPVKVAVSGWRSLWTALGVWASAALLRCGGTRVRGSWYASFGAGSTGLGHI